MLVRSFVMKRKVLFAALLVAVLSLLLSCASQEADGVIPDYDPDTDGSDLAGFVMNYSCSCSGYVGIASDTGFVLGYIENTTFADMAAKRISETEKKLNCKINVTYENAVDTVEDRIVASVLCATPLYDAIQDASGNRLVEIMRGGYLTGLVSYADVTDTKKWGSIGMNMALYWKDDQYGIVPAMWPDLFYMSVSYPFCINENIVQAVHGTDPRDYVENGVWTWDRFEESVEMYTYDTGSRQIYGFGAHGPYFVQMMFRSNGDCLVDYTKDSKDCAYYTPTAYDAFSRAYDFLYKTYTDCRYPSDDRFVVAEKFIDGEIGIVCSNTEFMMGTADAYIYTCDNFGVLPAPLGPNGDPNIHRSLTESMSFVLSVPVNCRDVDATISILDSLYEPLEGYETEDSIIKYMGQYLFFDERDARVLFNMSRNIEYAFFHEGARTLIEYISGYNGNPKDVAQALESYEKVFDKVYNDYLKPTYDGIISIWGDSAGN